MNGEGSKRNAAFEEEAHPSVCNIAAPVNIYIRIGLSDDELRSEDEGWEEEEMRYEDESATDSNNMFVDF